MTTRQDDVYRSPFASTRQVAPRQQDRSVLDRELTSPTGTEVGSKLVEKIKSSVNTQPLQIKLFVCLHMGTLGYTLFIWSRKTGCNLRKIKPIRGRPTHTLGGGGVNYT